MAPIEKNIRVRDENGNELEPTWPKRARGLVKSGRARFVSEDTIILTASDETKRSLPRDTEDKKMPETAYSDKNKDIAVINVDGDAAQTGGADSIPDEKTSKDRITIKEILDRIEKLVSDQEALNSAIERVQAIGSGGGDQPGSPGDIAGQAKAQAIAEMIRSRETTVQKTLDFYMKVYEDLKPNDQLNHKTADLGMINETVIQLASIAPESVGIYLDGIRQMNNI